MLSLLYVATAIWVSAHPIIQPRKSGPISWRVKLVTLYFVQDPVTLMYNRGVVQEDGPMLGARTTQKLVQSLRLYRNQSAMFLILCIVLRNYQHCTFLRTRVIL